MNRKLVVIAIIMAVLVTAGLPAMTAALNHVGVIPFARSLQAEYLTGTALTVILVLLLLLPSQSRFNSGLRQCACPVCGERNRTHNRYCPQCGSRLAT
jgi:hypothetical protein